MPVAVPSAVLPPLVVPFLLTLAISFLIGIGLRDYYEGEGKFDTFGTVRTFVFIGMLGFMLYTLPEIGNWAFLLGPRHRRAVPARLLQRQGAAEEEPGPDRRFHRATHLRDRSGVDPPAGTGSWC